MARSVSQWRWPWPLEESACAASPSTSCCTPPSVRRAAAAAAAISGRPSRRCTAMRMKHVGIRNAACLGTAFRKAPAKGCETAMKRAPSRRETRCSSACSFSHAALCTIRE